MVVSFLAFVPPSMTQRSTEKVISLARHTAYSVVAPCGILKVPPAGMNSGLTPYWSMAPEAASAAHLAMDSLPTRLV